MEELKKFKVVRDAPHFVCSCGNTAIDMARATAPTGNEGKLYLLCAKCGNAELITKEQYEALFK